MGRLGASFVCCSDYPAESVLANLRRNIEINKLLADNIAVIGHIWGADATNLLAVIGNSRYDVIVASECLWRHEQVDPYLTY